MTPLDQQRIAEWIGDAFAILCVRVGGCSDAETHLRLNIETILRRLRIPPLVLARTAPSAYRRIAATRADLRHIMKALDSCLAIFSRYEPVLTPGQRELQLLVREARLHAGREYEERTTQSLELVPA